MWAFRWYEGWGETGLGILVVPRHSSRPQHLTSLSPYTTGYREFSLIKRTEEMRAAHTHTHTHNVNRTRVRTVSPEKEESVAVSPEARLNPGNLQGPICL